MSRAITFEITYLQLINRAFATSVFGRKVMFFSSFIGVSRILKVSKRTIRLI